MLKSFKLVIALLSFGALFLSLAAQAAAADQPNWPDNYRRYFCHYTWPDGSGGSSLIYFKNLPPEAHTFPDGNQIKRGALVTRLASGHQWAENVDLAWKPRELPDPKRPPGTNLELTLPGPHIQCKNFQNFGDFKLEFFSCEPNKIVQSCDRLWP